MTDWNSVARSHGWVAIVVVAAVGCGPRMNVVTSTTLGLHATPGDGNTEPPQVTLAYKRAEVAVIPAGAGGGRRRADSSEPAARNSETDLFSAITAFGFKTTWFGSTELNSVIATGHAARDIVAGPERSPTSVQGPSAAERTGVSPQAFTRSAAGGVAEAAKGRADEVSIEGFVSALKAVTD